MDESRINSIKFNHNEAIDWMRNGKAITDGNAIFSISELRILDGWTDEVVCEYSDWDEKPISFWTLNEWENSFCDETLYPYEIPMNEAEAIQAMKEGAVVRSVISSDDPYPLYFFNTVMNPLKGFEGYVFRIEKEDAIPEIYSNEEKFVDYDSLSPLYEIYKVEENKQ